MGWCCLSTYLWTALTVLMGWAFTSFFTSNKRNLRGKHVMVTGGSSGIGLSVARDVATRGANVTLVARNKTRLEEAQKEVESSCTNQEDGGKVQIYSVDVTGSQESIAAAVREAESSLGPIYMLVNCAGFARAQTFEDIPESLVKEMMNVNFMGSFTITQEVVRSMKQQGTGGVVVFTSSQGGLLGLYGFTAYSAAKGALVKLAEALHMELKPHRITVTVCYPPDTQTPGFEEENKTKPVETKIISESSGLFQPKEVAKKLVDDALSGKFSSTVGLEGFMLTTLCGGMGPITDIPSILAQVFLSGLFRCISVFYLWSFASIVKKEHQKKTVAAVNTNTGD